jgi:hypothetical protein
LPAWSLASNGRRLIAGGWTLEGRAEATIPAGALDMEKLN